MELHIRYFSRESKESWYLECTVTHAFTPHKISEWESQCRDKIQWLLLNKKIGTPTVMYLIFKHTHTSISEFITNKATIVQRSAAKNPIDGKTESIQMLYKFAYHWKLFRYAISIQHWQFSISDCTMSLP